MRLRALASRAPVIFTLSGMGSTTDLRRELKRQFVPFLAARGFVLDQRHAPHFIDFRRFVGTDVHFAEIQWEKYGTPRFVLNVGRSSASGTVCFGELIPPGDVGPGQAPEYIRIQPRRSGSSTRDWFRQDNTWLGILKTGRRLRPSEEVVAELIALFPEAEEYLSTGTLGPHCKLSVNEWAKNAA